MMRNPNIDEYRIEWGVICEDSDLCGASWWTVEWENFEGNMLIETLKATEYREAISEAARLLEIDETAIVCHDI